MPSEKIKAVFLHLTMPLEIDSICVFKKYNANINYTFAVNHLTKSFLGI